MGEVSRRAAHLALQGGKNSTEDQAVVLKRCRWAAYYPSLHDGADSAILPLEHCREGRARFSCHVSDAVVASSKNLPMRSCDNAL